MHSLNDGAGVACIASNRSKRASIPCEGRIGERGETMPSHWDRQGHGGCHAVIPAPETGSFFCSARRLSSRICVTRQRCYASCLHGYNDAVPPFPAAGRDDPVIPSRGARIAPARSSGDECRSRSRLHAPSGDMEWTVHCERPGELHRDDGQVSITNCRACATGT